MRDILERIFNSYGYKHSKINKMDYYIHGDKGENYIVYTLKNLTPNYIKDVLDNIIPNIDFESLEENYKYEMTQNTSIIFLANVEKWDLTEDEECSVLHIEEDPYLYKKYVLWYTINEFENIESHIDRMELNIMNHQLFRKMKDAMAKDLEKPTLLTKEISGYMLLCRIFIKLPFLNLNNVYNQTREDKKNITLKSIDTAINEIEWLNREINDSTFEYIVSENEYENLVKDVEKELGVIWDEL